MVSKVTIASIGIGIVLFVAPVFAQTSITDVVSAYRQYKDVSAQSISVVVPTVVEVSVNETFVERNGFAVLDTTANRFEPSYFIQTAAPTFFTATSEASDGRDNVSALADGRFDTHASFEVPGDRLVRSVIRLHAESPIVASRLTIALDDNVALPSSVVIRAGPPAGPQKVIVAERKLFSTTEEFPQTQASDWVIEFTHMQPLRIAELRLVEDRLGEGEASLRFLAQPGHAYRIYFNPDRFVTVPAGESGNLGDSRDVKRIQATPLQNNRAFVLADVDSDGIADIHDNCVSMANADQADIDRNGLGDVCQDFDRDGVQNVRDNCQDVPNVTQIDTDGDAVGDACDTEESRLTEKHTWIPWAGIGFAAVVILGLFALTMYSKDPVIVSE